MGCATSTDAAKTSNRLLPLEDPRSNSTNPLAPIAAAGAAGTDDHLKQPGAIARRNTGVLHTLDSKLEHTMASDAVANSAEVERRAVARMVRHRSASVVLRDRSGYETQQPSAEEHVAHIERLGAIAGIHGLTPDPQQFAAPEVPASVMERHAGGCRSWMSGVVHPMPQALDGPPGAA